jgi:ABC-type antimicrobial peptide transport system permease subunit
MPEGVMVSQMRQALAALDPALPIVRSSSGDQMLNLARLPSRAAAIALSVLGMLAVVLAATGIHGVVAYSVARRRREIGIRMAIGASGSDVLRLIFARTVALLGAGATIGLLLALAVGRLLSSVVYLASPRDPVVLSGVGAIVAGVGLIACWIPARRALQVKPTVALRAE